MQEDNTKQSYTKWMFSGMPSSFATSPLGTFIPLYILFIGGTIAQVALAVVVFNFVTIVSSFFWGKYADATSGRKGVIVISYAMITLFLFLLYFAPNYEIITIVYAAIGLFAAAEGTYLNILVVETDESENWPKNFARLQAIQNVGLVAGLVIASLVSGFSSLNYFIIVLALSSLISCAVGIVYIRNPKVENESRGSRKQLDTVLSLIVAPLDYVRVPRDYFRNGGMRRSLKFLFASMGSYIGLFYISFFLFSASSTAYNADYPALLSLQGVTQSQVFTIIVVAIAIQTIMFYYMNRILRSKYFYTATLQSLKVRGLVFFLVSASFLFAGRTLFYSNLVLYGISAGLLYPIYYTASYSLFFDAIKGKNKGTQLGTYSGLGSIGSFVGSVVAGLLALTGVYSWVYLSAGVMVLLSVYAMHLVPGSKIRKKEDLTFSSSAPVQEKQAAT